jgi:hypothetical protein
MKQIRKFFLAAALAACAQPLIAAPMPFQGATSGSFSDPTTATYLGFVGGVFGPDNTLSGSAILANLGTFTVSLPLSNPAITATGSFNLDVTFTLPSGANAVNPISAAVSGTINKNNANNVIINFGLGQVINYTALAGSGSFLFTLNDVIFPNTSQSGAQQTLTGSIRDAVFNPASTSGPAAAAVPEPGTLALLGLGLAGIGYKRRKRAA